MRNLMRFLVQHHFLILFLAIETFSLFLLFSANPYQKVRFYDTTHKISGRFSNRLENILDYFSLRNENQKLAVENARLYNRLASSSAPISTVLGSATGDSIRRKQFRYITARVIDNTVNKQYNYITLDRGSESGIKPEMAVIGSEGVVGVVKMVSNHYSSVLSLLNRDFKISGKIKSNGYFGPLSWNGNNPGFATLADIPYHVKINAGDTVITSGYGGVFPEGFPIGVITDFRLKGGNYFEIRVKLSTDFRNLGYVHVIRDFAKPEIDSLETAASK
jgi:rod shape-determining protein MreC